MAHLNWPLLIAAVAVIAVIGFAAMYDNDTIRRQRDNRIWREDQERMFHSRRGMR